VEEKRGDGHNIDLDRLLSVLKVGRTDQHKSILKDKILDGYRKLVNEDLRKMLERLPGERRSELLELYRFDETMIYEHARSAADFISTQTQEAFFVFFDVDRTADKRKQITDAFTLQRIFLFSSRFSDEPADLDQLKDFLASLAKLQLTHEVRSGLWAALLSLRDHETQVHHIRAVSEAIRQVSATTKRKSAEDVWNKAAHTYIGLSFEDATSAAAPPPAINPATSATVIVSTATRRGQPASRSQQIHLPTPFPISIAATAPPLPVAAAAGPGRVQASLIAAANSAISTDSTGLVSAPELSSADATTLRSAPTIDINQDELRALLAALPWDKQKALIAWRFDPPKAYVACRLRIDQERKIYRDFHLLEDGVIQLHSVARKHLLGGAGTAQTRRDIIGAFTVERLLAFSKRAEVGLDQVRRLLTELADVCLMHPFRASVWLALASGADIEIQKAEKARLLPLLTDLTDDDRQPWDEAAAALGRPSTQKNSAYRIEVESDVSLSQTAAPKAHSLGDFPENPVDTAAESEMVKPDLRAPFFKRLVSQECDELEAITRRLRMANELTHAQTLVGELRQHLDSATARLDDAANWKVRDVDARLLQPELIDEDELKEIRSWHELQELIDDVAAFDDAGLPLWVWPGVLPAERRENATGRVVGLAADPLARSEIQRCYEWWQAQPRDGTPLVEFHSGQGLFDRLKEAFRKAETAVSDEKVLSLLEAYPSIFDHAQFPAIKDHLNSSDDNEEALSCIGRVAGKLTQIESTISPKVFEQLRDMVRCFDSTVEPLLETITREQRSRGRLISKMPDIDDLKDLLLSWQPSGTEPNTVRAQHSEDVAAPELQIRHPLSNPKGTGGIVAAALFWGRASPEAAFILRVPVAISLNRAVSEPLEVRLDVLAHTFSATEGDSRTVVIPPGATAVELLVSINLDEVLGPDYDAPPPSTFWVKLRATASGVVAKEVVNEHDRFSTTPPVFNDPFPQGIKPEDAAKSPLGAQKHLRALASLIENPTQCFTLTGPRRTGKSVLIKILEGNARSTDTGTVLVSTLAKSDESPQYFWRGVLRSICRAIDLHCSDSEEEIGCWQATGKAFVDLTSAIDAEGLPRLSVMKKIREHANRVAQRSAIYVIIDEAQRLLSKGGAAYGSRLRELIDHVTASENDFASIYIGLIGHPSIPRLINSDAIGAFNKNLEVKPVSDDDLLLVLRKMAKGGIESSVVARGRLVELAGGSFWLLSKLLTAIQDVCIEQGRSWFIRSDVDDVERNFVENFERKATDENWRYIRDALNESDDLGEWHPGDMFPIAQALALARAQGITDQTRQREEVDQCLKAWSKSDFVILEERVTRGIERLVDAGLYVDGTITQPLLARFLVARTRLTNPFQDPPELKALYALGFKPIAMPLRQATGKVHEGAQGEVYPSDYDGYKVAVRNVKLPDARAWRHFQSEVNCLEKLARAAPNAEWLLTAKNCMPTLRAAGRNKDARDSGLILYDWVVGHRLEEGTLSWVGAAQVGRDLSAVLCLLAAEHFVHRDIKPSNIIIRSGGVGLQRAVLVDFGVATAIDSTGASTLSGSPDFMAPEAVRKQYSSKSDVYSLGKTLQTCLRADGAASPDLRGLIERMVYEEPADRPTPEEVYVQMRGLVDKGRLDDQQKAVLVRLHSLRDTMIARRSKGETSDRWRSVFDSANYDRSANGSCTQGPQRLADIGFFLEQVVGVYLDGSGDHEWLTISREMVETGKGRRGTILRKLGRIAKKGKKGKASPFMVDESEFVGDLRNAYAHPDELVSRVNEAIENASRKRLKIDSCLKKVAGVLDSVMDLKSEQSMYSFVRHWLELP
jgi:tRNA A-37 threonylcarbamoyl transferase component Bud32